MSDVRIGEGKLAGKGVYAERDFEEGDIVNNWNLVRLSQEDFNQLPESEHKFVHSFWGNMYLFPEPSRYTNHSATPNTKADFVKQCDIALRSIKKGEMITTNATEEITFELQTFLEAYEKAANSCDFNKVEPLIADDAEFVFTNGIFKGKVAIRQAFEDTWNKIKNERYSISNVQWSKKGYRNAVCRYNFKSDGIVDGKRQIYEGYGKNTLRRIDGNWRIVHEHLSKANDEH